MQNEAFQQLLSGYLEWIAILNYAKATQVVNRRQLKYFLEWCEVEAIESLEEIESADYELYLQHLQQKTFRGKALSNSTIQSYFNVLYHVNEYLEQYGKPPIITKQYVKYEDRNFIPVILTKEEIEQLYKACDHSEMGLRNRAILTLFYSCGLRSGEGANLKLNDIDLRNGWVHVRKGKYYLERFVPLTEKGKTELDNYLKYARCYFLKEPVEWFLLSINGEKIKTNNLLNLMNRLRHKAEIDKKFNVHGLRHTIATHLLENGMALERIQQFLGHRHLQSTQIYTHILEQNRIVG